MNQWRILAIDDDPGTLELITLSLEDSYEVLTLSNPIEALDIAKLFEPDLLILDLMMPKVDGFHLLEIFRREKALKDLPVVILSAKKNKRDIQYGYQVGAVLYLTKPFQPTRLRRNLDFLFEHNPPTRKVKHLNYRQVLAQIKLLRCFEEGSVGFSSHDLKMEMEHKAEKPLKPPLGGRVPTPHPSDSKEKDHKTPEPSEIEEHREKSDTTWLD